MEPLRRDLCALARALDEFGVRLFLVGGYGLLLKAEYLSNLDSDTLAPIGFPRATRDLDLLLSAEVVVDAGKMEAVRDVLQSIGYRPKEGRENYQWERSVQVGSATQTLRVDVLGQIPEDRSGVSMGERRMRPHEFSGLHANPVPEGQFIHLRPIPVQVCDADPPGVVNLPHPFTYLLLKLFAFDDRRDDERIDHGMHHAYDLYRIVAMLTPVEWEEVESMAEDFEHTDVLERARRIVRDHFPDVEAAGALGVREQMRRESVDEDAYPVESFLEDLGQLLSS